MQLKYALFFLLCTISVSSLYGQDVGTKYWENVLKARNFRSAGRIDSTYLYYLKAFQYGLEDEEFINAFYGALRNKKFPEAHELFLLGCKNNVFSGVREIHKLKEIVSETELKSIGITSMEYKRLINRGANRPKSKSFKHLDRELKRMVFMDQLARKTRVNTINIDRRNSNYLTSYIESHGVPSYDSLGYTGHFNISLLLLHFGPSSLESIYPFIQESTKNGNSYLNECFAYQVSRASEGERLQVTYDSVGNLHFINADSSLLINGQYFYTVLGETQMYLPSKGRSIVYPFDPTYSLKQISEFREALCLDGPIEYVARLNAEMLTAEEVYNLWFPK